MSPSLQAYLPGIPDRCARNEGIFKIMAPEISILVYLLLEKNPPRTIVLFTDWYDLQLASHPLCRIS